MNHFSQNKKAIGAVVAALLTCAGAVIWLATVVASTQTQLDESKNTFGLIEGNATEAGEKDVFGVDIEDIGERRKQVSSVSEAWMRTWILAAIIVTAAIIIFCWGMWSLIISLPKQGTKPGNGEIWLRGRKWLVAKYYEKHLGDLLTTMAPMLQDMQTEGKATAKAAESFCKTIESIFDIPLWIHTPVTYEAVNKCSELSELRKSVRGLKTELCEIYAILSSEDGPEAKIPKAKERVVVLHDDTIESCINQASDLLKQYDKNGPQPPQPEEEQH